MIKKLTFIIILIFGLPAVSCSMCNSFKLKIGNQEYIITTNNINDTFKVTINYNTYNMTPSIYASYSDNLSLVKFSIENGADINTEVYGKTALIIASETRNFDIVKYLV